MIRNRASTLRIARLIACLGVVIGLLAEPAQAADLLVFAAASMKNALDEANAAYQASGGGAVKASYAASSVFAKQIEQDAPADLFISADTNWMDYLAERHLIKAGTRSNLLGNRLVLIAPQSSTATLTIKPGFALAAALGDGKLSMGEPNSVPAGIYGKAALTALGVWDQVRANVIGAESVRAALAYVSRGEAPFGIVYETDAKIDSGVRIVGAFPEGSHDPIVYPVAIMAKSRNADAEKYLAFLKSTLAGGIFEKYGFSITH